jgi:hypothetical protein
MEAELKKLTPVEANAWVIATAHKLRDTLFKELDGIHIKQRFLLASRVVVFIFDGYFGMILKTANDMLREREKEREALSRPAAPGRDEGKERG